MWWLYLVKRQALVITTAQLRQLADRLDEENIDLLTSLEVPYQSALKTVDSFKHIVMIRNNAKFKDLDGVERYASDTWEIEE